MDDLFKKFINTGVGFLSQGNKAVQTAIDKLVKESKISEQEGKKIMDDLMKSGETKRAELEKQFMGLADNLRSRVGLGAEAKKKAGAASTTAGKSGSAAKASAPKSGASATKTAGSATSKAAGAVKSAADKTSAAADKAKRSAAAKAGAAKKAPVTSASNDGSKTGGDNQ